MPSPQTKRISKEVEEVGHQLEQVSLTQKKIVRAKRCSEFENIKVRSMSYETQCKMFHPGVCIIYKVVFQDNGLVCVTPDKKRLFETDSFEKNKKNRV
jgi:hypothetical protein